MNFLSLKTKQQLHIISLSTHLCRMTPTKDSKNGSSNTSSKDAEASQLSTYDSSKYMYTSGQQKLLGLYFSLPFSKKNANLVAVQKYTVKVQTY